MIEQDYKIGEVLFVPTNVVERFMVEQADYRIGEVLEHIRHQNRTELCQVVNLYHIKGWPRGSIEIKMMKSGKRDMVWTNTASLRRMTNHLGMQIEVIEDLW